MTNTKSTPTKPRGINLEPQWDAISITYMIIIIIVVSTIIGITVSYFGGMLTVPVMP